MPRPRYSSPRILRNSIGSTSTRLNLSPFTSSARASSNSRVPPPLLPPHPIFISSSSLKSRIPRLVHASSSTTKASKGRLSDDEFDRLLPLDQIKLALSLPRPTSFTPVEDPRLEEAVKLYLNSKDLPRQNLQTSGWTVKKFAWYGDRFWDSVVAEVLSMIDLKRSTAKQKGWGPGEVAKRKGALVSNILATKLAADIGLAWKYKVPETYLCHLWEAYLAALYWQKGRRALLEFLVPIIKSEYEYLEEQNAFAQPRTVVAVSSSSLKVVANGTSSENASPWREAHVRIVDELSHIITKLQASTNARLSLAAAKSLGENKTSSVGTSANSIPSLKSTSASDVEPGAAETVSGSTDCEAQVTTVATKDEERLRILGLPKLKSIVFPDISAASGNFRSVLDSRQISYLFCLSPFHKTATLQLPGVPLIAVKAKGKSQGRKDRILLKLVQKAVSLGHFKLSSKPNSSSMSTESNAKDQPAKAKKTATVSKAKGIGPSTLKAKALYFSDACQAHKDFFGRLNTHKVKFSYVRNGPRCTLSLPGYPPITSEAKTEPVRSSNVRSRSAS